MSAFTTYAGLFAFEIIAKKPCVCGGIMSKLTWIDHFYVNLFFTGVCVAGLVLEQKKNYK
jgi:putative oxidoreductase